MVLELNRNITEVYIFVKLFGEPFTFEIDPDMCDQIDLTGLNDFL